MPDLNLCNKSSKWIDIAAPEILSILFCFDCRCAATAKDVCNSFNCYSVVFGKLQRLSSYEARKLCRIVMNPMYGIFLTLTKIPIFPL